MKQLFMPGDRVRIAECSAEPNQIGKEAKVLGIITAYEANIIKIEAILKRELTHEEIETVKKRTPVSYYCVLEGLDFLGAILNPEEDLPKREYIYVDHIHQSCLRRVEPLSDLSFGGIIQALRKGKLLPLPL